MKTKYLDWLAFAKANDALMFQELEAISMDKTEILERFHKYLEFGTGGLRGIIGSGTNRINRYTIRKASQALSLYLMEEKKSDYKVAIAYDSRNFSDLFALEAAKVFSANNIQVFLFDSLKPTPELSFAIRYLSCDAGIVITASHNPAKYNGFKVYASDGGQITRKAANKIYDLMKDVHEFNVKIDEELSCVQFIGHEIDEEYYERIMQLVQPLQENIDPNISIVYTPLHGSGYIPVTEMLNRLGFYKLDVVEEQRLPDGNFSTVKSPNPEDRESFEIAISLAKVKKADLIFATDPDCDRIGVAVLDQNNDYQLLTGNQIGALLVNYMLETKKNITSFDAVIKTIVTSELGAVIASYYGATVFNTLTGFKYIGEKINEFEMTKSYKFIFGYEESYGYLAGNFVRDKDAVIASTLIALMAAYYKTRGTTILAVLNELFEKHGFFKDDLISYTFEGVNGLKKIEESIEKFRNYSLLRHYFTNLEIIEDYKKQLSFNVINAKTESIELPCENVIKLKFLDQSWVAIRPSGTEPKLKIYISALGKTNLESESKFKNLLEVVMTILE